MVKYYLTKDRSELVAEEKFNLALRRALSPIALEFGFGCFWAMSSQIGGEVLNSRVGYPIKVQVNYVECEW